MRQDSQGDYLMTGVKQSDIFANSSAVLACEEHSRVMTKNKAQPDDAPRTGWTLRGTIVFRTGHGNDLDCGAAEADKVISSSANFGNDGPWTVRVCVCAGGWT